MKFFSSYTNKVILTTTAASLLMFLLAQFFGLERLISYLALQPSSIFAGQKIWTALTSIFIHASFTHLFVNMFSLFFIGNLVEKIIGKKRFIFFYIISGIFAGLFFAVLSNFLGFGIGERIFGSPAVYGLGASGAIFGLLGLLAMLTPRNRVFLLAGPILAIILNIIIEQIVPIPAVVSLLSVLVTVYIVLSIFFIFSFDPRKRKFAVPIELPFWLLPVVAIIPLIIIGLIFPLPIGNMAHLGGLIAGLLFGLYLKRKYPKRAELISRMFSK
jgi:membrane associated rhomboid family serine protease